MVNKPLIRPYFLGGVALGGGQLGFPWCDLLLLGVFFLKQLGNFRYIMSPCFIIFDVHASLGKRCMNL